MDLENDVTLMNDVESAHSLAALIENGTQVVIRGACGFICGQLIPGKRMYWGGMKISFDIPVPWGARC